MKQLLGHVSLGTAYEARDYARGRRKYIKYWVDTRENFGQRLVTAFVSPATGEVVSQAYGDFLAVVVLVLNDRGCVEPRGLSFSAAYDPAAIENFEEAYTLDAGQKQLVARLKELVPTADALSEAYVARQAKSV